MRIRVELVGQFRDIMGSREIIMDIEEGSTVTSLLKKIAEKYGSGFGEKVLSKDTGNVSEDVTIVLNGKIIPVEEASFIFLRENDTVVLMPEVII